MKSKLLKDLLKVLSGNVVAQGLGFILVMFMTRGLGPEKYGVYVLFITIYDFLRQLADFGISTSYVKLCSDKINNNESLNNLFFSTLISKLTLSVLLAFLIFLFSGTISLFFFDNLEYAYLIKVIGISLVFAQIFNVFVTHLQSIQKFKSYSLTNISNQIVRLVTMVLISYFFSFEKIDEYVVGYVSSFGIIFLLAVLFYGRKIVKLMHAKFSFDDMNEIFKMGFWVFLSGLAVVLIMRLDMFMLKRLSSDIQVGFYSVAMQLALVFPLITTSIQATLMPKVGEYLKDNSIKNYVWRILSYAKYLIVVLLLLLLIAPLVVGVIFSSQYSNSIPVFRILIISVFFGLFINPISLVFYHKNKAKYLTILNWIQLIVNFILNYFMIPKYGAVGAGIATLFVRILGMVYIIVSLYFLKEKKSYG